MIKFKSTIDENLFRSEWLKSGLPLEEFFVKRQELEIGLTDWERSQRQKINWQKYRWKYLRGIRDFHNSTAGKRFHRNLAKFLATRSPESLLKAYQSEKEKEREVRGLDLRKVKENLEFLIAVLSAGVHALIEERYYKASVDEAVEYKFFLSEVLDKVKEVLEWVYGEKDYVDWDFWIGIVHPKEWERLGLKSPESVQKEGEFLEWLTREMQKGKVEVVDDDEEGTSE